MKKAAFGIALLLAALALVACGGSDDDTTASGGGGDTASESGTTDGEQTNSAESGGGSREFTIQFEADPGGDLAYTEKVVKNDTGNWIAEFTNPQPVPHDIAFEDPDGNFMEKSEVITEGTDTVLIEILEPGDYTFYCSVPGHREAGMEGTLKVKESPERRRVREEEEAELKK